MERPDQPPQTPVASDPTDLVLGRAAPPSKPVGDEVLYRPGARWAAIALLVPVLVACVGAVLALNGIRSALPVLAGLLLVWFLVILLFWFNLAHVRLMPDGIEVTRPWRRGTALTWGEIERLRTNRGQLIMEGKKGKRLSFRPLLLRDGWQLRRRLLLRVPSQVLVGSLRQEAQALTVGQVYRAMTGELAGMFRTRAAWPWRVGSLLFCVGAATLAGLVAVFLPAPGGIVLAFALGWIALGALWTWRWLARAFVLAEGGVVLAGILPWQRRACGWETLRLVEVSSGGMLLRLRGELRLLCVGPRLLAPRDRDLVDLFIHEYCERRGVARVVRRRFW